MPSWLIKLLVNLAVQFGVPYLVEKFNWIPASFWEVVKDILKHVQEAPNKEEAVRNVRNQLSSCGIGCAPELKGK